MKVEIYPTLDRALEKLGKDKNQGRKISSAALYEVKAV